MNSSKLLNIALFFCLMLALSVTSVRADTPGCDSADPDKSVMGVMKNHSDAMRVRDKAYSRQIIKRNDPSLGMTCFDRAMGVTSRLGAIFSDVKSITAAPNNEVFTATTDPTLGMGDILALKLAGVVSPVLSNYLDDFTGTLSEILGTTVATFMTAITATINGILAPINAAINTVMTTINTIQGFIRDVNRIARLLSLPMPTLTIVGYVAAIKAARQTLMAAINAVITTIRGIITTFINNILGYLLGAATDLACDRIQDLWDDGNPNGGATSIEGSGLELGAPYFTFADLFSGAPPGAAPDLMGELDNAPNVDILNRAMNDLNNLLDAPGPGKLPSWKVAPVFPAGTDVNTIINAM